MICLRPHSQNSSPSLLILNSDPLHHLAKYDSIFCLIVDLFVVVVVLFLAAG